MLFKKYIKKLKLSISSIEYHIQTLNRPFIDSFYFFMFSMLAFGILMNANTALTKLPIIKDNSFIALDELNSNFDTNLEIIWADNQLELNRESVNVSWPSTLDYKSYELPVYIAVISNSDIKPSESQLSDVNNSLFYINKNNFYANNKQLEEEWVEYPLSAFLDQIDSYSINKQNLPKIISGVKESINQSFSKIQFFTAIIFTIFFIFSRIWFLFAESILVFFLFKIYNLNLSLKKVLKLSMNIMVPAGIIDLFTRIFYPNLNLSMNSISFWVILSFISFYLNKNKSKK